MAMAVPTPMDEYTFDLRGYILVPGALDQAELAAINGYVDALGPLIDHGGWYENVEVHSYYGGGPGQAKRGIDDGYNLQHIYEAGPVFETLIDHPKWFGHVEHFLGAGEPFMHELFLNVRGKGG